MIDIKNKVDCCGCNACGDVCAKHAITFKTDIEGFWYPEVNKDLCTDCGLCEKVCPVINKGEWHTSGGYETPKCYAAIHKNIEIRFDSTSGGAFSAFAEEIYKQGGFVGGAIYNEDWSVSQFLSSEKSDLPKLRSSKYLQSRFDGFYIAVREALKTGKPVVVCGGPCQMAALKRFLHKPYENLIIIDYICRGIASPLYFKKFIAYLESKHNSKVVYYKAKNKELGWRKLSTKIQYANKDVDYIAGDDNPWLKMQYKVPEIARPSCFECPFKGFPRTSDITIGDLWAKSGTIPAELDNDLGTSIIFANSEKGAALIEKCKKKLNLENFDFQTACEGNRHLLHPLLHSKYNREDFYSDLNGSFENCIDKYIPEIYHDNLSTKQKLKNIARFLLSVTSASGISIKTWWKNIYYNFLTSKVQGSIRKRQYIIIHKHSTIVIESGAKLILGSELTFGAKRIKGSELESRLLIEKGGKLITGFKPYFIMYGADIEVFRNATLEIRGGLGANIGLTITCGNRIVIGENTGCGRNITIRDNNGNHFISVRGYKTGAPVVIKDHVWLTESCTIMPGTTIESGAIISARSVVSGHIPSFTIVSGDPAKVVENNIYWKS